MILRFKVNNYEIGCPWWMAFFIYRGDVTPLRYIPVQVARLTQGVCSLSAKVNILVIYPCAFARVTHQSLRYPWSIARVICKSLRYPWSIARVTHQSLCYPWSITRVTHQSLYYPWSITRVTHQSLCYPWSIARVIRKSIYYPCNRTRVKTGCQYLCNLARIDDTPAFHRMFHWLQRYRWIAGDRSMAG